MALPKPVWSDDDIRVAKKVVRNPSIPIWIEDPTKLAVLRAIVSCGVRVNSGHFDCDMVWALVQKWVCSLHSYSLEVGGVHY